MSQKYDKLKTLLKELFQLDQPDLAAFTDAFTSSRRLLVGGDGIPVEEFLLRPVAHWVTR